MPKRKNTNKKVPKNIGNNIHPSKTPRINQKFDTGDDNFPAWRFSIIDLEGPFGWQGISKNEILAKLLPKIRSFESMTWKEIMKKRIDGNHAISPDKLSRTAKKRLGALQIDDIETLISLRLSSIIRVWGIRSNQIYKILWWDPNHQVYPTPKRHT